MKIVLNTSPCPSSNFRDVIPAVPAEEYERRLSALVQAAGTDWVLVFADREHSANLTWLVDDDPRFEEALLVLGRHGQRKLIVGNEGMGYLPIVPGPVDVDLCQTFSLTRSRAAPPPPEGCTGKYRPARRAVGQPGGVEVS